MEAFSSFVDSTRRRWNYDSLKNFRQISPVVQNHLKLVYLSLCCTLVASAVRVWLHLLWNIGGFLTTIRCFVSMIWLLSTPANQENKRVSLLMAAGLFKGASIGPLIELAIKIDTSVWLVLSSSHVGKASGILLLGRPAFIWALRPLLVALRFFHFWRICCYVQLYFGLLVFVGYIVVNTQEIIEKAHLGDLDYVKHTLTFFTDFVAVFVRILIIMLKNSMEKETEKKRKRSN
ncbi:hypothetical protein GIB67_004228 [Kingdonia uniflora]|uniref:Bax inhibitor 1 n=1 Tax=Kingdonia uniflora TaxID=39325 RepID=A0A7J7MR63_9MAGN|nr:hypothetical protein GIB67_004228 [Kingdonia uniflora]